MKKLMLMVGVALSITAVTMRAQQKTDPELNRLAVAFAAAVNAKDPAAVAAFYAEDGVLMPSGAPIVTGRANIEKYFAGNFTEDMSTFMITPLESSIFGDRAFEAGTSTLTHGTAAALFFRGPAVVESGKYVVVYRRVGDAWKIAYDIFNDN